MSNRHDIGPFSAYAIAVKYGYSGTEEEWIAEVEANRRAAEGAKQDAETARNEAQRISRDVPAAVESGVNQINAAGTAQITSVNDAGSAQVKAVENKGTEVLDNIPEDYQTLIARIKSGKPEDADYHLGFYLDENDDLCQKEG